MLSISLVLAACGPTVGRDGLAPPLGANGDRSTGPKTLSIAFDGEPGNLVSEMEGGGVSPSDIREAVHQHLATYDDRGALLPQLATQLPSTAAGTWIVRPDGTMQTTYQLRAAVTWHDGTPLTARDFVFGLVVHKDRELPIGSPLVARHIDRIDTPNELTLVIEWAKTYPFANAITEEDLGPLPAHLLENTYATDKDRFPNLPYWKNEFVGVGPYRLVEWSPGSHITLRAYDGFYGGRAKIETIVVRFIPSNPTVVANLLAGSVDGAAPDVIDFTEILLVNEELKRAGRSPLIVGSPAKWRIVGVQFRPEIVTPRDLLDVRVRTALLHAIDRKSMAEVMYAGQTPVSDTFIPSTDLKWDWVKDAVVRYDYDPQQAQNILRTVGWRRGIDGSFVNAAGERVALSLTTTADPQGEQEAAIVADSWKSAGIGTEQIVIPQAQQRDRQVRASFPAFEVTSGPVGFSYTTQRVTSVNCPMEENRWTGNNRGCYRNPALDRVVDALNVAIEPTDQQRLYRDLVKFYADELPILPLYFKIDAGIFREGVTGPRLSSPDTNLTWNVIEWDIN